MDTCIHLCNLLHFSKMNSPGTVKVKVNGIFCPTFPGTHPTSPRNLVLGFVLLLSLSISSLQPPLCWSPVQNTYMYQKRKPYFIFLPALFPSHVMAWLKSILKGFKTAQSSLCSRLKVALVLDDLNAVSSFLPPVSSALPCNLSAFNWRSVVWRVCRNSTNPLYPYGFELILKHSYFYLLVWFCTCFPLVLLLLQNHSLKVHLVM